VLAKHTCPKCKNKYEANDAHLLWVLDANLSNAYPILPNYANIIFHFHKDLTNLIEPMGTGADLASTYFDKWACNTREPMRPIFPENVPTNSWVKWNSKARFGLHLLQIFGNSSIPPSPALSTYMGTPMHLDR
jgi:hypothetical protein